MKHARFWVLILLLFHGCAANDGLGSSSVAQINIAHLSNLYVGMSQADALRVMRHPHKQLTFEIDGSIFDVWFYITKPTVLGQSRMVPQNLTPLTFKNGELIGWGASFYNYLAKRKEAAERQQAAPVKPFEQIGLPKEDVDLEKNLQKLLAPEETPSSSTPIPVQSGAQSETQKTPPPSKTNAGTGKQSAPSSAPSKISPQKTQPTKIKPGSPPPKPAPTQYTSMSAKPRQEEPSNPPPSSEEPSSPKKDKKPLLKEEDREMLEEESEQNFDQT